jgi:hypothetical protein
LNSHALSGLLLGQIDRATARAARYRLILGVALGNEDFYLMLSRTFQAAQTPEIAKVFCFFSSERKTFLTFCALAINNHKTRILCTIRATLAVVLLLGPVDG